MADTEPGIALCELLQWVNMIEGLNYPGPEQLRANSGPETEPLGATPLARKLTEIFTGTDIPSIFEAL